VCVCVCVCVCVKKHFDNQSQLVPRLSVCLSVPSLIFVLVVLYWPAFLTASGRKVPSD